MHILTENKIIIIHIPKMPVICSKIVVTLNTDNKNISLSSA